MGWLSHKLSDPLRQAAVSLLLSTTRLLTRLQGEVWFSCQPLPRFLASLFASLFAGEREAACALGGQVGSFHPHATSPDTSFLAGADTRGLAATPFQRTLPSTGCPLTMLLTDRPPPEQKSEGQKRVLRRSLGDVQCIHKTDLN